MAKRLLLINPGDDVKSKASDVRNFAYAPPGLAYLAGMTPPDYR